MLYFELKKRLYITTTVKSLTFKFCDPWFEIFVMAKY